MTHELVGKRVNLKVTKQKVRYAMLNMEVEHEHYTMDDPLMEALIKLTFADYRVFLPGQLGTADHNITRTNIYISSAGIITEVSNG